VTPVVEARWWTVMYFTGTEPYGRQAVNGSRTDVSSLINDSVSQYGMGLRRNRGAEAFIAFYCFFLPDVAWLDDVTPALIGSSTGGAMIRYGWDLMGERLATRSATTPAPMISTAMRRGMTMVFSSFTESGVCGSCYLVV